MNKKCEVEWCKNNRRGRLYCSTHTNQMNKYGRVFNTTQAVMNDIKIKGDTAIIVLRNKHQEITGEAIIDLEDLEKVKKIKWSITSNGYPRNRNVRLHQFLIGSKKGYDVDHIDRDKMNNRKSNFRYIKRNLNAFNAVIQKNNTTGVTGVTFRKDFKKYTAQICANYKNIYLGSFSNKSDAVKARKEAELKYFGEVIKR